MLITPFGTNVTEVFIDRVRQERFWCMNDLTSRNQWFELECSGKSTFVNINVYFTNYRKNVI